MKGIILAGGSGTRLYPITKAISKQLMPIYDKPMIYYPLSTLMLAGIKEILIISTPLDMPRFQQLLGDGSQLGCHFEYKIQESPRGLADAFIVGAEFIGKDKVAMILGDNIFYGSAMGDQLAQFLHVTIFARKVSDPHRYGVVAFDENMKATKIEEKPKEWISDYAIPGIYIFDKRCVEAAKAAKPSERGEIEITEIHNWYLERNELNIEILNGAWFDAGTFESYVETSHFVLELAKQGKELGAKDTRDKK